MKQTAVEWLIDHLQQNKFITESQIHLAKQMEKQQQGYSEEDIEQAFKVGFTFGYLPDTSIADKDKCFNRWFKIFKLKNK